MKTKILAALLAAALVLSLSACGNGPVVNEPEALPESSETAEPEETSAPAGEGEYYFNVVYYAGEDLPAGGYIVTCTGTDSVLDVLIFASKEDLEAFQGAETFTFGEYRNAVETYAWSDFALEQGDTAFAGLREGSAILLNEGQCEFTKYDSSASQTMYPGVYVVGEEIGAGKITVKCASDYMQLTLFASEDDYLGYHKTSRFTYGEVSDALEMYAASNDYIDAGESAHLDLQEGMILLVENGAGEFSASEGPVINS